MSLVYSATLGSPIRKAVALKLADHADDNGRSIYPAIATIAQATEICHSAVEKTLRDFRKEGFLVVTRKGGGRNKSTRYRMHLPWLHYRIAPVENGADKPRTTYVVPEKPRTRYGVSGADKPRTRYGGTINEPSEDREPGKRKRVVVEGDWP